MNSIDFFTLLKREFIGIDYILESCFVPHFYKLDRVKDDKFYASIHFFRLYNDYRPNISGFFLTESVDPHIYCVINWSRWAGKTPPKLLWNHKHLIDAALMLYTVLKTLQVKYMAS